jgi:hypothetical protein
MTPNAGHLPPECEILDTDGNVTGHRAVMVKLFNGSEFGPVPSAGGRPNPTNWSIRKGSPHPFDIEFWEIV